MKDGKRCPGHPATTEELQLFQNVEANLYTAVVSDALDQLGLRHQAMREYLRPLSPALQFAGWARTVICVNVYHIPEKPYELEIEALDSILPGEIVVVSTQRSTRTAPWGELLSTAAKARQARGAVVDGLVRDIKKIEELGFPVFAAGIKPVDSTGRGIVIDYNIPAECGGVVVTPGDMVFGDDDGVVVVPANTLQDVMRIAFDKVNRENGSRRELGQGAYLRDVYMKYGVL
jgi:regulator of RNase E activity RraA